MDVRFWNETEEKWGRKGGKNQTTRRVRQRDTMSWLTRRFDFENRRVVLELFTLAFCPQQACFWAFFCVK